MSSRSRMASVIVALVAIQMPVARTTANPQQEPPTAAGISRRADTDLDKERRGPGGVAARGSISCATGVGCQIPDVFGQGSDHRLWAISDSNAGVFDTRVADNFRTDVPGTITSLCWWGVYVGTVAMPICDPGPGDSFTVTYYNDDAGGLSPGSVLAGPLTVMVTNKFTTGRILNGGNTDWPEYQFEGTHAPVMVGAGCFWIEILNDTGVQTTCWWAWTTAPPGDLAAAQDDFTGWDSLDRIDFDFGFCVDVSIAPNGCSSCGGPGTGDCCTANGTPGCDDLGCCLHVCISDPFCCSLEWDTVCAAAAQDLCANCSVASLQRLYDTGSGNTVRFNGADSLLGWSSGNLDNDLDPQRRTVQAFTLPAGAIAWRIPVIWCNGFIPAGVVDETIHIEVFARTPGHPSFPEWPGPKPVPGDLVATATAPHPQAGMNDPRPESPAVDFNLFAFDLTAGSGPIILPPGDYWLTVFASNDDVPFVPSNFAWVTNAADGINNFCTDQSPLDYPGGGSIGCSASPDGTPMMYRARMYPPVDPPSDGTGYRSYHLPPAVLDVDPNSNNPDPNDLYNASFAVYGERCNCPPVNDNCVDRIEITNGTTPFTTIGGTLDGSLPCGPGGADIWYNYNSQFTGTLVVTTCDSFSNHDTALAVYDGCGCPASLANLLACNDDFCDLQSRVEVPVVAGNCYKIQVFGLASDITIYGFEEPQETPAVGEVTAEATGDFDGTAFTDVISVVPTGGGAVGLPGAVQVFLNQGTDPSGVWQGLVAIDPVTVGVEPRGIAVGLFNMDLFPDVAVTNATDDSVSILINQGTGDGTFNPPVTIEMVGNRPTGIVADDFTEDGFVDLAVALELDEAVVLLIGDGSGGFSPPAGLAGLGGLGLGPVMLVTGDFDDNKCPDIAGAGTAMVAGPIPGQAFVALGQLGGGFGPPAFYNVGVNPVEIATGDLNEDSFAEIIVANNDDASLTILINNGAGLFMTSVTVPVGSSPKSVEAVDLSGDVVPDLAVTAIDPLIGPAVQVLENLTTGQTPTLAAPIAFGVNADPNFVVSADLNNDGASDLVTGNTDDGETGGSVTVLLNTPPPSSMCPWDCGDGDGNVGIVDFLALLAGWGVPGACDFDGGGIGIVDFLDLLAHWGACP